MRIASLVLAAVGVASGIHAAPTANATDLHLVPQPQSITPGDAAVELRQVQYICVPAGNAALQRVATQLAASWEKITPHPLRVTEHNQEPTTHAITLRIDSHQCDANPEAYRLELGGRWNRDRRRRTVRRVSRHTDAIASPLHLRRLRPVARRTD